MKLNITFDEKLFDCFRRGDFATEEKIGNAVDAFLKGVKTIYVGNGVNIDVGDLSLMSSFNTRYTNCENRSDEHLLMEMDGSSAVTGVVPRSFFNMVIVPGNTLVIEKDNQKSSLASIRLI